MKVPRMETFVYWMRSIGLLIAGGIIGAASFMVVYQHNMTELIEQNTLLRQERDQLKEEIEPLKTYRDNESTLKTIEIHIESMPVRNPPDVLVQTEIKKKVHEQLKPLIGLKVNTFYENPGQIKQSYGERILPNINDKDYVVSIDTVIILFGKLNVWIKVVERND